MLLPSCRYQSYSQRPQCQRPIIRSADMTKTENSVSANLLRAVARGTGLVGVPAAGDPAVALAEEGCGAGAPDGPRRLSGVVRAYVNSILIQY